MDRYDLTANVLMSRTLLVCRKESIWLGVPGGEVRVVSRALSGRA